MYRMLREYDPGRAAAIIEAARRYAAALQALGVRDPWALEASADAKLALRYGGLLLLLVPALAGAALGWAPYRLAGVIARRMTSEDDVLGTVKLLAGALLLLLSWGAEATLAGVILGPLAGLAVLIAGPVLGHAALVFGERADRVGELLRARWLRWRRPDKAARLLALRRELASEIASALQYG